VDEGRTFEELPDEAEQELLEALKGLERTELLTRKRLELEERVE